VSVCPTGAIQWKGPKILLPPQAIGGEIETKNGVTGATLLKAKKKSLIARCVAWGLALAVLGGAMYYFNFVHKDAPKPDAGFEVGDACNAMDLAVYNGTDGQESFNVQDQLGKVTVINFWGTWCGPCIAELPHFDQVATDYVGRVTVVAVHSDYKGETAADWIAENYPETSILFAQDVGDGGNGAYYTALGGEGDFPMTIIVNKDGVITFACRGSITHDELVAAVEEALGK
jgi:thiol-disulfide isomerase/thioredoxin